MVCTVLAFVLILPLIAVGKYFVSFLATPQAYMPFVNRSSIKVRDVK